MTQNYAQALPDWQQANTDGFDDPQTSEVSALAAFNGYLYAGTHNATAGARIFRSPDGVTWSPVTLPGFGSPHDTAAPAILDLTVFYGRIYASTGRGDGPGQIWRALDGWNWSPMVIAGFGDQDNIDITALAEYNGAIYAGVTNLVSGAQIWSSNNGNNNTWKQVAPAVPGTDASTVTGFAVFNGALYAAIESADAPVKIWRNTGGVWETVVSNGFGNSLTISSGGLAEYAGYLYVGTENSVTGPQLWRTNDGGYWEQVLTPGLGDPNNQKVENVFPFQNQLYISIRNLQTGIELWRSTDGISWEQINLDGFGDRNNTNTNYGNAAAEFLGDLYAGTSNIVNGGELWRMQPSGVVIDTPTPTNTPTVTPTNTPTGTPTHTPTDTPTATLTDTPTSTPTGLPTHTSTFTPTATPAETATSTPTLTPTVTPSATQTNTPTYTATPTPLPTPVDSTPGKANGGGVLGSNRETAEATFGFMITYSTGDSEPKGSLIYQDHKTKLRIKTTSFDLLVIQGYNAWFTGTGITGDGQVVNFKVEVNTETGTFKISIPALNGYEAGGALSGGNISIH